MGNLVELAKQGKFFNVKAEKVEALRNERAIIHFISTPDLDRGGDIVDPKGMNDDDFAKSPSVWYNHEYMWNPHALPVGKSLWRKKKDEGVLAKTQFADHAFAEDVYELHAGDFMSTWSIGWMPDTKKEKAVEYDDKNNILKINHWEMFEYSSAPIAMNPNAGDQLKGLKEMHWKSIFTKELIDKAETELILNEQIKSFEQQIKSLNDKQVELQGLIEAKNGTENISQAMSKIEELENVIKSMQENLEKEIKKETEIVLENSVDPEKVKEELKASMADAINGEFRRRKGLE